MSAVVMSVDFGHLGGIGLDLMAALLAATISGTWAAAAGPSIIRGPRRDLMALGVYAPIVDVRRTVETAAGVRPGAGVPAHRPTTSGQQHRQTNHNHRKPIRRYLDHKIGTLSPGKEADITVLAADRINVFPLNNVPGTIVTLMDTSNVDTVFVAGRVVKWQGKLVGVDLGRLRRMIDKSRDGVLARAGYAPDLFGTCCRA